MEVSPIILLKGVRLDESVAATWTTVALNLATAPERGIGAVILGVDMAVDVVSDIAAAGAGTEKVMGFVMEEDKATEIDMDDGDLIAAKKQYAAGDGTDNIAYFHEVIGLIGKLVEPANGYVTLRDNIFIGVKSSCAAAKGINVIVKYKLIKLSEKEIARYAMREAFE